MKIAGLQNSCPRRSCARGAEYSRLDNGAYICCSKEGPSLFTPVAFPQTFQAPSVWLMLDFWPLRTNCDHTNHLAWQDTMGFSQCMDINFQISHFPPDIIRQSPHRTQASGQSSVIGVHQAKARSDDHPVITRWSGVVIRHSRHRVGAQANNLNSVVPS
jgi:hypothetical protein